ncbi:ribosomal protein S18 [Ceratobasidium sp. AG-I]|nr:ribosomal protein S18 [Ceratobasidium sp. AG-I]
MFSCLRISRASVSQACSSLRTYSTRIVPPIAGAPLGDEKPSIMHGLADLVQGAAEPEQGGTFLTLPDVHSLCPQDAAALPNTLLEEPRSFNPNKFANPNHLSREHRIKHTERRRKDPTMGPGRKFAQSIDVFRKLNIDPLDEFRNDTLLQSFVSDMGKINSRAKTGLTWRSQRRVGKAIRRARAMGIIPLWNRPTNVGYRAPPIDWTNTQPQRNRT